MYILRDDTSIKELNSYFICSQVMEDNSLLFNWKDGKKKLAIIKPEFLPLKFITNVKIEPEDFVQSSYSIYFLGNERVAECFQKQIKNNEVEIIPAEIYNKLLDKTYKYWVFNILNIKSVINLKKSKKSKFSDHLMISFLSLELNNNAIDNVKDICYDPNMIGEYIINQELADEIKSRELTGMEIIPIGEYTNRFYNE
jgi:hypothetical protein